MLKMKNKIIEIYKSNPNVHIPTLAKELKVSDTFIYRILDNQMEFRLTASLSTSNEYYLFSGSQEKKISTDHKGYIINKNDFNAIEIDYINKALLFVVN